MTRLVVAMATMLLGAAVVVSLRGSWPALSAPGGAVTARQPAAIAGGAPAPAPPAVPTPLTSPSAPAAVLSALLPGAPATGSYYSSAVPTEDSHRGRDGGGEQHGGPGPH